METKHNINFWLDTLLIHNDVSPEIISWVKIPILLLGMFLICFLLFFITKKMVINTIHKIFIKTKVTWDDVLVERKVFDKLAFLSPAFFVIFAVPYIFQDFPRFIDYAIIFSDVFIVGIIVWTVNSVLGVFDEILSQSKIFKDKPITSYIQVAKILIYFMGGIMILSLILGKSPFYFLGAMGAMTAILLLIFKDTILGFVASIQMSVYDMIRVGDWISMPKYEADGDVVSINLNTVKVQNWDKTFTTIPTYAFITDSFKNWRGMSDSGGRRIKRAIHIKMSSFKFCDDDLIEKFKKYRIIRDYIFQKETEIRIHNQKLDHQDDILVNNRRFTNIGIFRIYAERYLFENQNINQDMTTMVRQLEPTSKGLPLEVYCFSKDKEWVNFEKITADIFDHLLTVIPEFELEIFEELSGKDLSSFVRK